MSIQPISVNRGAQLATQQGAQFGQMERVETKTTRNLEAWASDLEHAFALAEKLCSTMFVPVHFRGKPAEGAAAILYGDTLEIPPMVSLRTIYVVHGTPALYAQQMYAIALSKGHEIERVHADNQRVEFRARRRGTKDWQKVEWTIERARQAKYTSNSKYQENPIGMLTEKCKAEAAKLVAPDALAGMNSVEEIELGDFESTIVEEAPAPVKTTKITRKPKADAPDPAVVPAPAAPAPAVEPLAPQEPEPAFDPETGEMQDDEGPAVLEPTWDEELEALAGNAQALRSLYNRASAGGADKLTLDRIVTAGQEASKN